MARCGLLDARQEVGVVDLTERQRQQRAVRLLEIADERFEVQRIGRARHLDDDLREPFVVPGRERDHVVGDEIARLVIEPADDAEIEEADRIVVEQHQVAGVDVAVEEAVEHDALKPCAQPIDELGLAIDTLGLDLLEAIDAKPDELLHHEHLAGRVLVLRHRSTDVLVPELAHDVVEPVEVRGLLAEVELLGQGVREVVDDAHRVRELRIAPELREQLRHEPHDLHVSHAAGDDARALDLDHDRRAIAQLRGVNLRDRGRRELLRLDIDQVCGLLRAELFDQRALDVFEWERLDAIEHLLELFDVRIGEHARRRRDDLTELDERGPEVFAHHSHQQRSRQLLVPRTPAGEREPHAPQLQRICDPQPKILGGDQAERPHPSRYGQRDRE